MEFKGTLGKYKIINTEDGEQTLWSEYYDENCHSTSGAKEETIYNYVLGCKTDRSISSNMFKIFEVGFGLGLGIKYTFEWLESNKILKPFHFISCEIDPALIEWAIKNTKVATSFYPNLTNLKKQGDVYSCSLNGSRIDIICGDIREKFKIHKNMLLQANAIYQDAFSPKRNPALWTLEWFKDLKSISSEDVILSTYSAAQSVRKTMHNAGWVVENHPGFGRKKSSTRAKLLGKTTPEILDRLRSDKIFILKDSMLF